MTTLRSLLVVASLCAATVSAAATAGGKIVLLPFDNIAGSDRAALALPPIVEKAVSDRGWTVIHDDAVDPLLEAARVRYLDSVDDATRTEITTKLGADAILFVTIGAWREGENPLVATSARAVRADGTLLWSDAASVCSADTERILALGRQTAVETIAHITIARMMRKFPPPGRTGRAVRGESGFFGHPKTYRSAALPRGQRKRVCILPLDAKGAPPEAARIVGNLLTIRMEASEDFDVIEPAVFRAAARAASIRSFRNISSTELATLSEKLGTTLFLRGSIFTYRDVPPRAQKAFPEIQLDLNLIDTQAGRILWAANHSRKGDDYEGFLLLGSVTNIVTLADRVISEMVAAEEQARLRGPALTPDKTKGPEKP